MSNASALIATLASFTSLTCLYESRFHDASIPASALLVEAFLAVEEVQAVDTRDMIVLSSDGVLSLNALLGQQARLEKSVLPTEPGRASLA